MIIFYNFVPWEHENSKAKSNYFSFVYKHDLKTGLFEDVEILYVRNRISRADDYGRMADNDNVKYSRDEFIETFCR